MLGGGPKFRSIQASSSSYLWLSLGSWRWHEDAGLVIHPFLPSVLVLLALSFSSLFAIVVQPSDCWTGFERFTIWLTGLQWEPTLGHSICSASTKCYKPAWWVLEHVQEGSYLHWQKPGFVTIALYYWLGHLWIPFFLVMTLCHNESMRSSQ